MTPKILALELTKYKLSQVCQDRQIQGDFPEVAEQCLATIMEIDRQIISLRASEENIILDENNYATARN